MEILSYLRKTLIKFSNKKNLIDSLSKNESLCGKCNTNDRYPTRYCKCCGKKLIQRKALIKRKSINTANGKMAKVRRSSTRKDKNSNLENILPSNLFTAKKTYKLNSYSIRNYHVSNYLPNDKVNLQSKAVQNEAASIKPKTYKKPGMLLINNLNL